MEKTICFVRNYTVQAEGGKTYLEDDVATLESKSCEHFVSRGVAKYVTDAEQKPAKKKVAKKKGK